MSVTLEAFHQDFAYSSLMHPFWDFFNECTNKKAYKKLRGDRHSRSAEITLLFAKAELAD